MRASMPLLYGVGLGEFSTRSTRNSVLEFPCRVFALACVRKTPNISNK